MASPAATSEVKRKSKATRYAGILVLILLALIAGWVLGGGNKAKEAVGYVAGLEEYVYGTHS